MVYISDIGSNGGAGRHMKRRITLAASIALAGLLGCGGSGSTTGGQGSAELALKASASSIRYGDPVSISWSSSELDKITSSNFGVGSRQFSGSLVDRPASTTTYLLTGESYSSGEIAKAVTVKVLPSSKRVLLVADAAIAGAPQLAEVLQQATTYPIVTSLTIPSTTTADVVVLAGSSGSFGPSDEPKIRSFLAAGKGVIVIGRAIRKLATGNVENGSLGTAVGTWLAGANTSIENYGASIVTSSPGIPISATLYGKSFKDAWALRPIATSAHEISIDGNRSVAFLYSPAIGGRVGYLGNVGIESSASSHTTQAVLLTQLRWVSGT